MTNASVLLIASIAGIAVAVQGQAMGALNRSAGTATAIFATYASGGLLSAIFWFLRRPASIPAGSFGYGVVAGALGLVIVGGIGYAAPRIGLSRTLVITVAAQLGAALLIDAMGVFGATPRPLDASKLAGVALTLAGVWLVVK